MLRLRTVPIPSPALCTVKTSVAVGLLALVLAALPMAAAWADDLLPPPSAAPLTPPEPAIENLAPAPVLPKGPDAAAATATSAAKPALQLGCSLRDYGAPLERGQIASAIFNTCSGFSLHKPMFLSASYSPRYPGAESEVVFQISGKGKVWDFGPGALYFAYSQKSFFQIANEKKSKAFRESDYNPEVFVRLPKPLALLRNWSLDAGFEHESNGEDLPNSRSWNRLYIAPYWTRGRQAFQLKAWWRIDEDKGRAATDPKRDDNPDIGSYYGYVELHYRQDFAANNSLIDVMLRGNPGTGRGAMQTDFSTEIGPVGAVFIRLFNGYGESLIDYNRSVTRIAVGVALQR